jgi:RNA polymerase sigma factor (sigma-70 family)
VAANDILEVEASSVHSLYVEHHGWLVRWLRGRLYNNECAQDLAQDTFVRVIHGCDPAQLKEPRAYLSVIAKRLVTDHFRRRSLEQAYLVALAALPEQQHPSPEDQAIILESLTQIDTMLHTLSGNARRAFLLAQLEGMSYDDIARHLAVSVRTVTRYIDQGFEACLLALHEQQ